MSEALEFLLNASIVNTNTCSVSLDDALRKILADDIYAKINE
jgi:molybdopterin biosynthesis enzyme